MDNSQRLYWSLSLPLKWIGLTLDEWGVMLLGLVPGIILINSANAVLGLGFLLVGIIASYFLKKFKKLSEYFLIKSYLLSRGMLPVPSRNYPNYLRQRVGK